MTAWNDTIADSAAGETLVVDERLILAPCGGRFCPTLSQPHTLEGDYVIEGQVVGSILSAGGQEVPVRSSFAGWMMGYMLPNGAPVRGSEPVVWLRQK